MVTVKSGYPPQSLALVAELPFSSLGIKKGEQIIVNRKVETAAPPRTSFLATSNTTGLATASTGSDHTTSVVSSGVTADPPSILETGDDNSGEPVTVAMDGGFLVHRVSTG